MKGFINNIVKRYGAALCALVIAVAPIAVNSCRYKLYQPKEPDGLEEFALSCKRVR
ncbi:MAG: cyclic lactone autoinducer peptide [Coprococcus sp.]